MKLFNLIMFVAFVLYAVVSIDALADAERAKEHPAALFGFALSVFGGMYSAMKLLD